MTHRWSADFGRLEQVPITEDTDEDECELWFDGKGVAGANRDVQQRITEQRG
jgi:hypothetical protein